KEIREKLHRLGDLAALSQEQKAAVVAGVKEGETKIKQYLESGQKNINGWKVGSLFGDSAFYNGDWLKRAAAAQAGIYGNDAAEHEGEPRWFVDSLHPERFTRRR